VTTGLSAETLLAQLDSCVTETPAIFDVTGPCSAGGLRQVLHASRELSFEVGRRLGFVEGVLAARMGDVVAPVEESAPAPAEEPAPSPPVEQECSLDESTELSDKVVRTAIVRAAHETGESAALCFDKNAAVRCRHYAHHALTICFPLVPVEQVAAAVHARRPEIFHLQSTHNHIRKAASRWWDEAVLERVVRAVKDVCGLPDAREPPLPVLGRTVEVVPAAPPRPAPYRPVAGPPVGRSTSTPRVPSMRAAPPMPPPRKDPLADRMSEKKRLEDMLAGAIANTPGARPVLHGAADDPANVSDPVLRAQPEG